MMAEIEASLFGMIQAPARNSVGSMAASVNTHLNLAYRHFLIAVKQSRARILYKELLDTLNRAAELFPYEFNKNLVDCGHRRIANDIF